MYVFKISNKNRKTLCKVNKKGTRPNVWNIYYYFDFSPLFEFIIFIAILCHLYRYTSVSTLIPCISTLIPHIFCISTQIPRIPTLIPHTHFSIPFLLFPPLFSTFPSFRSPILILAFTDSLLSL